jgi:hypothetical protein
MLRASFSSKPHPLIVALGSNCSPSLPGAQVLFASDTDLSTPARLVCLDGVVVHQSEDKRAFVVEARRSIFQEVCVHVNILPHDASYFLDTDYSRTLGLVDKRRPGPGC